MYIYMYIMYVYIYIYIYIQCIYIYTHMHMQIYMHTHMCIDRIAKVTRRQQLQGKAKRAEEAKVRAEEAKALAEEAKANQGKKPAKPDACKAPPKKPQAPPEEVDAEDLEDEVVPFKRPAARKVEQKNCDGELSEAVTPEGKAPVRREPLLSRGCAQDAGPGVW